jgi:hypothetical protein
MDLLRADQLTDAEKDDMHHLACAVLTRVERDLAIGRFTKRRNKRFPSRTLDEPFSRILTHLTRIPATPHAALSNSLERRGRLLRINASAFATFFEHLGLCLRALARRDLIQGDAAAKGIRVLRDEDTGDPVIDATCSECAEPSPSRLRVPAAATKAVQMTCNSCGHTWSASLLWDPDEGERPHILISTEPRRDFVALARDTLLTEAWHRACAPRDAPVPPQAEDEFRLRFLFQLVTTHNASSLAHAHAHRVREARAKKKKEKKEKEERKKRPPEENRKRRREEANLL